MYKTSQTVQESGGNIINQLNFLFGTVYHRQMSCEMLHFLEFLEMKHFTEVYTFQFTSIPNLHYLILLVERPLNGARLQLQIDKINSQKKLLEMTW